jgi:hypothetical protein
MEPVEEAASVPETAAEEDLYGFENIAPETAPSFEPEPFEEPPLPEPEPQAAAEEPAGIETADIEVSTPELSEMHYDAASAANELGLPKDVVDELIQDFSDHANSARAVIEGAVDSADVNGWRQQAVEMKGIADNLRMNDIASALKTLEAAEDPLTAKTAADQLYGLIKQL